MQQPLLRGRLLPLSSRACLLLLLLGALRQWWLLDLRLPLRQLRRLARPSFSDGTQWSGDSSAVSMSCSTESGNLVPWNEKNLMPLS